VWDRDPVRTFERLRDSACEAIDVVCVFHHRALAAPPSEGLLSRARDWDEALPRQTYFLLQSDAVQMDNTLDRLDGAFDLKWQRARLPSNFFP